MVGHEQYYPRRRRAERIPSAPRNTAWHRGPAPHSGGKGGSFFESRAGLLLESAEALILFSFELSYLTTPTNPRLARSPESPDPLQKKSLASHAFIAQCVSGWS
jgi:hypothetical protein